jgi:hypothetical protein
MHNRKDKTISINNEVSLNRLNNGFGYQLILTKDGKDIIKVELDELELRAIMDAADDLLYFD